MNRSTNTSVDGERDAALQRALRELPPPTDSAALEARVIAQWQSAHGAGGVRSNGGAAQALSTRWLQRRWWIGAGGLALLSAVAVMLWLQRPDPALEELLQPDVLSQMAAGEM